MILTSSNLSVKFSHINSNIGGCELVYEAYNYFFGYSIFLRMLFFIVRNTFSSSNEL